MTDEEREVILSQQRQRQYALEALSYEDPSLYKAAMDKQAADGAAFTAADDMESRGAIQALGGYQTGQSRRDLVNFLTPDKGFRRDSAEKFMGGGSDNFGLGVADLALVGGAADAYDAYGYLKDMSQRNRDAEAAVRQELIDEGYGTGSMDFYRELQKRLPEKESSGEAMFDFALGAFEGAAAAKIAKVSFAKIGNFFKRFNPNASRLPDAANALPTDTPEFGALAAQQQQADAVDVDFDIPFEDIRIDTNQPMNIVENTPEAIPQGEILFSPSLIAARELKQEKGSYEQIRPMMINNGAKAD